MIEKILLAVTLFLEAGNQPNNVRIQVAQVILERRQDPRWPDTIEGVIRQPRQFKCWNKRRAEDVAVRWNKSMEECMEITEKCISGEIKPNGFNHYHNANMNPVPIWARGHGTEGVRMGDLIFYKL